MDFRLPDVRREERLVATRQRKLFEDRDGENIALMGFEWDDVLNEVIRFVFRLSVGNRNATFTLTRTSDGTVRTHDFIPGINYVAGTIIAWNPPFTLAVTPYLNPKTGQTVGLENGWTAELALG